MIDTYGWSEALARTFAPHAAHGRLPGRVIVQHRGLHTLMTGAGEVSASLAGRLVHEAAEGGHPAVGDWVAFAAAEAGGRAVIHAVLPRRTAFVRKAADSLQGVQVVAANVDTALLVASMNADFNPRRLERYLAAAWQSGAAPLVVLTKADLAPDPSGPGPSGFVARAESVAFGAPVLAVSAVTGEGLAELARRLAAGETCALLGSSGAGKSTLLNALAGAELAATAPVRADDARGRHTTTRRELVRLSAGSMAPGALVIDTPGMRELGLIEAGEGLDAAFEDIEALARRCRFADCGHGREPGCAVRAALEDGRLEAARWRGFDKLRRELAHQERREDRLARETERRRWITLHKAGRAARKAKERW